MTYWHGGPKIVGNIVRPPAETGVCRSDPDDTGDGWVYISQRRHLAMTYAATCNGWLYEVEPIGEVEQDPGSALAPGASLRCRSATIVRRFRPSRSEADPVRQMLGLTTFVSRSGWRTRRDLRTWTPGAPTVRFFGGSGRGR